MHVCLAGHGGRGEETQAWGSKPGPKATAISGRAVTVHRDRGYQDNRVLLGTMAPPKVLLCQKILSKPALSLSLPVLPALHSTEPCLRAQTPAGLKPRPVIVAV